MFVVTFADYTPVARFDTRPWTLIRVDEAALRDGPWTTIDTIVIDPVDADPAQPAARSFTTELATLERGWYRVAFVDATGDMAVTEPVAAGIAQRVVPTVGELRQRSMLNLAGQDDTALTSRITQAVAYLEALTYRVPFDTAVPESLIALGAQAVQMRVEQLVSGGGAQTTRLDAAGITSYSVPGWSETRSGSGERSRTAVLNPWAELADLIWLLMTEEAREDQAIRLRGEEPAAFGVADIDLPAIDGLSDYWYRH